MTKPIYLDNNATTQVDPRVIDSMIEILRDNYGNPSSKLHFYGINALELVEKARKHIAALANADPQEVIFTSGATESINLVLRGLTSSHSANSFHIVTIATEHSATLDTLKDLESKGLLLTVMPVKNTGLLDLDELETILKSKPQLFTISHANNEIGTIQDIASIARLCKQYNVMFHLDAAQSFGKIPVRFSEWKVDLLSVSGHKLYGPKGVGCLILRQSNPPIRLSPQITGGSQERGLRSGTLNVPGIVGFGRACEIADQEMPEEAEKIENLRDEFMRALIAKLPDITWNGTFDHRLPGNINFSIPGIRAEFLLLELRNHLAISAGSACNSRSTSPSHVLKAIGVRDDLAFASLRACVGRFNSHEEILNAADIIYQTVQKIKI